MVGACALLTPAIDTRPIFLVHSSICPFLSLSLSEKNRPGDEASHKHEETKGNYWKIWRRCRWLVHCNATCSQWWVKLILFVLFERHQILLLSLQQIVSLTIWTVFAPLLLSLELSLLTQHFLLENLMSLPWHIDISYLKQSETKILLYFWARSLFITARPSQPISFSPLLSLVFPDNCLVSEHLAPMERKHLVMHSHTNSLSHSAWHASFMSGEIWKTSLPSTIFQLAYHKKSLMKFSERTLAMCLSKAW